MIFLNVHFYLSGPKDAEEILRLVPSHESFKLTLRVIKLWAKSKNLQILATILRCISRAPKGIVGPGQFSCKGQFRMLGFTIAWRYREAEAKKRKHYDNV